MSNDEVKELDKRDLEVKRANKKNGRHVEFADKPATRVTGPLPLFGCPPPPLKGKWKKKKQAVPLAPAGREGVAAEFLA